MRSLANGIRTRSGFVVSVPLLQICGATFEQSGHQEQCNGPHVSTHAYLTRQFVDWNELIHLQKTAGRARACSGTLTTVIHRPMARGLNAAPVVVPSVVRFADFEVDVRAGELRKHGRRVRLQEQPLRILNMLLERPGELVTREELRQNLWPADTFVDFDHGLNCAVARLRETLCDSAETPRFVETVPRRGYRFVGSARRRQPRNRGRARCPRSNRRSESRISFVRNLARWVRGSSPCWLLLWSKFADTRRESRDCFAYP